MRGIVVFTGLPASGKSTVAAPLADRLGAGYLSQDRTMEALFDTVGVGDRAWARVVSQAAMSAIHVLARASELAVLDAWWPPDRVGQLDPYLGRAVQIFCSCPADIAVARFQTRARHPGHRDEDAPAPSSTQAAFESYAGLPLPCPKLTIDTSSPVDIDSVERWVREQLEAL
jgi:predicted kinase